MSRYTCNSCSACGGKCDECSANVCINNMEKHREIFKLNDDFNSVIYYAIQNLYDKCYEIKNNLYNNYGIYIDISYNNDKIVLSDGFIYQMEMKKDTIKQNIIRIDGDIKVLEMENESKIKNVKNKHEQKLQEITENFNRVINEYKLNNTKYENKSKIKKEEINNLNNKINYLNIDMDKIIQSFANSEREKAEKNLEENMKEIDNKYNYKEIELVDSQVELKSEYLNEIKKISEYSDKIPNFYNFINLSGLNKYLN